MTYDPSPIPTDHVRLPADLDSLTERLAEHIHDVWAAQRIAEGWTHGPRRDDEARTHPGLVPYGQLSESEKEYDRLTALGTLRAILAMGYEIRTLRSHWEDATRTDPTHAELAARLLRDAANFFRTLSEQNPPLTEQMTDNAEVFEQVADRVEKDPGGTL